MAKESYEVFGDAEQGWSHEVFGDAHHSSGMTLLSVPRRSVLTLRAAQTWRKPL
jgi:hypothetical protein